MAQDETDDKRMARREHIGELRVRAMRMIYAFVARFVGGYLVYYGIYALDTDNASSTGVALIDDWSSRLSAWLQDGGTTLGWVFAALVAVGLALAVARRHTNP